jgi:uncharacterized protein (TIGR02594 family)
MKTPLWLAIAWNYLGTKEKVGPGSNPTITGWAKRVGGWIAAYFTDDDIPWCALFVNQCLHEAGIAAPKSLAAKDYATWGVPLPAPALGAIVVFKRPGGHHVGFYLGQRIDGAIRVRGGNQSNAVTDTWIDGTRLIAIRWPSERVRPDTAGAIVLAGDGQPLSTNEG